MKTLELKQMENIQAGNPCPNTSGRAGGWFDYWAMPQVFAIMCANEYFGF